MTIRYSFDCEHIDWNEVATVFGRAPLGNRRRDPERLRRAFEASYAVLFAFDSERLIGVGRALSDGEFQAAIYDLALLPEYQGRGIGSELVRMLCARVPVDNIILYAVPGREGFYERLGFKKMRTAMARLNEAMSAPERGYLE